ncbi:MAG: hypothetical protein NW224_16145 [Leptolyngbyaceae cyanobacterium bins.302]|nr:hypothetical protein [Leptolyngbyaceae cyanobacterium bins.302]
MNKFVPFAAIASLSFAACLAAPANAQVAEVPNATRNGDFTTARVMGNRGYYQNTKWLVVDSEGFLNCRTTANGAVKSRLMRGSVITAVFDRNNEAVVFSQGSPWLRVNPQIPDYGSGTPGVCFVRANVRYVAPISQDFIRNGSISLTNR